MSRRRRSFLLLGLALLLGSLAASDVAGREAALQARLGATVPVVVAKQTLVADRAIRPETLAVRQVPARFAPRGSFSSPGELVGLTPSAPVPAGADLSPAVLGPPEPAGAPVREGERVAEVLAAGPPALVQAGTRVDVLITRDRSTTLALQDVEVLQAEPHEDRVRAQLRTTLRQAVHLAAAQSFAREIRLLPRAAGDRGRSAPLSDPG